ncbi:MAG: 16S rRNA (guanine(527)-N(7))-methyltransferase RsmG [Verrucomicrobiota bacterium]
MSDPIPESNELPPCPPAAVSALGAATVERLTAYGRLLATDGVVRGLIGPREVPRLWDRHLLNCAAPAEAIPAGARVADIGSGAGLPGLVLALVRDDIQVILIEPLQRRCDFLNEAIRKLGLAGRVTVRRGKADLVPPAQADIVTSRAVSALDNLAAWSLPHCKVGGRLLALKGQKAVEEIEAARPVLAKWGADADVKVIACGESWLEQPVLLVAATRRR